MTVKTIAILMPGDMGHACAKVFKEAGYRVITDLSNRSTRTKILAQKSGIEDLGNLENIVLNSELILSILPPEFALNNAINTLKAFNNVNKPSITYVDCNAISPMTTLKINKIFSSSSINFVDGGIIGNNPIIENGKTRLYVSGPAVKEVLELDGKGMQVKHLNNNIGTASGMKMVYASATKGTFSLHAAVATVAHSLNLTEDLFKEFEDSQPNILSAMEKMVPRIPLDAKRWKFEMDEIAKTYSEQGITSKFHEGASEIMELAQKTPIAKETRETVDKNRTLIQALDMYIKALK